jgi:uncharacterized protein Usg
MSGSSSYVPELLIPNGSAKVEIFYYFPDRPLLVAPPLIWEVDDYCPAFPRVHRFLRYWQAHIEAPIQEVVLVHPMWGRNSLELPENRIAHLLH